MEYGVPKGGLPLGTLNKKREKSIGDLWLLWSALDALGICIYAAPPTRELRSQDILALVKTITHQEINMEELFHLRLMRLVIQREMNQRLAVSAESDTLPDIFFNKPINSSGARLDGVVVNRKEFLQMRSAIIDRLMWTEDGGVDESSPLWKSCSDEIENIRSKIL